MGKELTYDELKDWFIFKFGTEIAYIYSSNPILLNAKNNPTMAYSIEAIKLLPTNGEMLLFNLKPIAYSRFAYMTRGDFWATENHLIFTNPENNLAKEKALLLVLE